MCCSRRSSYEDSWKQSRERHSPMTHVTFACGKFATTATSLQVSYKNKHMSEDRPGVTRSSIHGSNVNSACFDYHLQCPHPAILFSGAVLLLFLMFDSIVFR